MTERADTANCLRVVLADDELVARRRLTRLLEAMGQVVVVGTYENAHDLLKALPETQPDVVLLDIQMPELTGLEASSLIDDSGPYVIFVTAHSEHALDAFELGALDYLLKPVEPARLLRALDRARRARGQLPSESG